MNFRKDKLKKGDILLTKNDTYLLVIDVECEGLATIILNKQPQITSLSILDDDLCCPVRPYLSIKKIGRFAENEDGVEWLEER